MQSICDQLLFEQTRSIRNLKKLKFIWTDRDPVMMNEAPVVRRSSTIALPDPPVVIDEVFSDEESVPVPPVVIDEVFSDEESITGDSFDFFSQILSLIPAGMTNEDELREFYDNMDLLMELDAQELDHLEAEETSQSDFDLEDIPSHDHAKVDNSQGLWNVNDSKELEKILEMQLYLTGNNGNLAPNMPNAINGRPNIKDIFIEMKKEALSRGESRVAVCVCAPLPLSNLCRKACIVFSNDLVQFDFHGESMEV